MNIGCCIDNPVAIMAATGGGAYRSGWRASYLNMELKFGNASDAQCIYVVKKEYL